MLFFNLDDSALYFHFSVKKLPIRSSSRTPNLIFSWSNNFLTFLLNGQNDFENTMTVLFLTCWSTISIGDPLWFPAASTRLGWRETMERVNMESSTILLLLLVTAVITGLILRENDAVYKQETFEHLLLLCSITKWNARNCLSVYKQIPLLISDLYL